MLYDLVEAIRALTLRQNCFTSLLEILRKRLYPLLDNPLFALAACLLPDQSCLLWKDGAIEKLAKYYRSYLTETRIANDRALDMDCQAFVAYMAKHQRTCNASNSTYLDYWKEYSRVEHQKVLSSAALCMHSMALNSTNCERLFSVLRRLHTYSRNSMSLDTLANMTKAYFYLERNGRGSDDNRALKRMVAPPGGPLFVGDDRLFERDLDDGRSDTEASPGNAIVVDPTSFADVCSLFPNLEYLDVNSPLMGNYLRPQLDNGGAVRK